MGTCLQNIKHKAPSMLAIALFLAVGSSTAPARQQERPRAKAWLGVSIRDVTEKITKENKLSNESGAYVTNVAEHSPADSVGIEERDIIVEFGQQKIDGADALVRAVEKSRVGDKVNIVCVRKGEKKNIQVVLAKFPRRMEAPFAVDNLFRRMRIIGNRVNQGMQLMELNDQLGEYFGVTNGSGILVERVKKRSAAEKAGIRAGDVLLKIGKRTIDDLEDVSKALSKYDEGDKVDVEVLRKGVTKTLSLEVEEERDASSFEIFGRGSPDGEMFQHSPFEENHFKIPQWEDHGNGLDFRSFGPDMEILERNLRNLEKSFKDNHKNLLESVQHLRIQII